MAEQRLFGENNPPMQMSKADLQKDYEPSPADEKWFSIEKKDGNKIGNIGHRSVGRTQEIGYAVLPSERKKGTVLKPSRLWWTTCSFQKGWFVFKIIQT